MPFRHTYPTGELLCRESFEDLSSNCSLIWLKMGAIVTLRCPVRHTDIPIFRTGGKQVNVTDQG